jgi:xanthine dehydrogenase small subunit
VALTRFSPRATLLDWLREEAGATGTKEGCGEGDCGACTIVLARNRDGVLTHEAVNACVLLLGQVDGAEVLTVEDLAEGGELHPVQQAMVDQHGSQCGFCTPGIVMSLFALYHRGEPTTRAAICDQLAGNLCRCTGYRPIVDAALETCTGEPEDRFARHKDAILVGGATDVGLWITKLLRDPRKIIWLGRVAGLDRMEANAEGLDIYATTSLERALPRLAELHADIGEMMRRFGSAQVRAAGTVGGNIANGSPIGDLPPALIALGASVELRHGDASRVLPLEDFFIAYGKQDRAPGEYVRRIHAPRLKANQHYRSFKVSKRFDEDISAVMSAFRFTLEGRRITEARIAYGGMAATPKRASGAEKALVGANLDDPDSWSAAIAAIGADYSPLTDMRATSAYRSRVAANLLLKALLEVAGDRNATRIGELHAAH